MSRNAAVHSRRTPQEGKEWLCPNFGHENLSGPKSIKHQIPQELRSKISYCSWPPKHSQCQMYCWANMLGSFCAPGRDTPLLKTPFLGSFVVSNQEMPLDSFSAGFSALYWVHRVGQKRHPDVARQTLSRDNFYLSIVSQLPSPRG